MPADKILTNFSQIFCPTDHGRPLKGKEMQKGTLIENGYIAIQGKRILAVGTMPPKANLIDAHTQIIDYSGHFATPGLIDSHTHLVYGGSRENEFSKKLNGVNYLEILEQGGGILSTVNATRNSSIDELFNKSAKLLEHFAIHGVTTVEAKSGYGLDWESEKKQLEVVKKLNQELPLELISTFMAAHAVPPEYQTNRNAYIDLIINEMLPNVASENLAEFCDVFCETGVFTVEEAEKILVAAKKHGFKLKIHADEIDALGGAQLAGKLEATSAEHLMKITPKGINALAKGNVIANLLPGTTFSLMTNTYAPAREMLANDLAIVLSSDSNPGSCPTANLQFIMQLGCFALKLTPIEVFNAVTINAAYAVDRGHCIGSLDPGKYADIAIFDAKNIDYPLYFFATNLVSAVYKHGNLIVKNRQLTTE